MLSRLSTTPSLAPTRSRTFCVVKHRLHLRCTSTFLSLVQLHSWTSCLRHWSTRPSYFLYFSLIDLRLSPRVIVSRTALHHTLKSASARRQSLVCCLGFSPSPSTNIRHSSACFGHDHSFVRLLLRMHQAVPDCLSSFSLHSTPISVVHWLL